MIPLTIRLQEMKTRDLCIKFIEDEERMFVLKREIVIENCFEWLYIKDDLSICNVLFSKWIKDLFCVKNCIIKADIFF